MILTKSKDMAPAQEALTFSTRILNEDDEPMKVVLITDKIIMANKLKRVSNPIMFDRNRTETVDGLFSKAIFGDTPEKRMRTYGYIDLHEKFFHPYVYEVLSMVIRNVDKCAAGEGVWKINELGDLKRVTDESDPEWNPDNTGLTWLITNYHKLKFVRNNSIIRNERITFLESLTDDEIFISKWLVWAIFYRDVEDVNGRQSIPEINYNYMKLIQYAASLKDDIFSFYNNSTRYNIQMELINIRRYGKSLVTGKRGLMHLSVMGKSIQRGSRDVISTAVQNSNHQRPEDNPIDIFHTGIPLAKCLVLGYNLMMRYLLNFFRFEFCGSDSTLTRVDVDGEFVTGNRIDLADQSLIYTQAYIDKKMKEYKNSYGTRFDLVTARTKSGKELPVRLVGRYNPTDTSNAAATTIMDRPMTWTDLFYIAAVETLEKKHVWITRYPLVDYSGTFPSLCCPVSTVKTMPVKIGNTIYKTYPVIDLKLKPDQVATQFIDTVTMSNLYLSATGADYDGDTVSVKMVYIDEANREADRIMHSPIHFLSVEGNMIRDVGNEAYLTFYCMTKY